MPEPKSADTTTTSPVDAQVASNDPLTPSVTDEGANVQFEEIKAKVVEVLSELPGYVSSFFGEYQKPIITLILIVSTIVTVKVLFAVVDALNDVPLLAPTFELIGIGYSIWFVYRYLLRASNRQELGKEFQAFIEQITGGQSKA